MKPLYFAGKPRSVGLRTEAAENDARGLSGMWLNRYAFEHSKRRCPNRC